MEYLITIYQYNQTILIDFLDADSEEKARAIVDNWPWDVDEDNCAYSIYECRRLS